MKIDKEESKRLGIKVMRTNEKIVPAAKKHKKTESEKNELEEEKQDNFLRDE